MHRSRNPLQASSMRLMLAALAASTLPTAWANDVATATPAGPRVAVLDYSADHSAQRAGHLARFEFVILSSWFGMQPHKLDGFVRQIKAVNPSVQVAHYSILSESAEANPKAVNELSRNDWWLRNAVGERVQWTSAYGAWEVNVTRWAPTDDQGRRWPQWKAAYDTERKFGPVAGFDYVFSDTVMAQNVRADWRRTGRDSPPSDPEVRAATIQGHVDYWSALRELNPGLKVMANASPDFLAAPGLKGRVEGAFLEGMIGKPYSMESKPDGWRRMMARYREAIALTAAPHTVVFQIYTDESDLRTVRYGLASAMLDDGLFAMSPQTPRQPSPWYDEYSAPIGKPVDAPPREPTASGMWIRRYSGGMVLVNPGPQPATIDVGPGYRRLAGSQDPAVNHGRAERNVTLGPREGLLLLKR